MFRKYQATAQIAPAPSLMSFSHTELQDFLASRHLFPPVLQPKYAEAMAICLNALQRLSAHKSSLLIQMLTTFNHAFTDTQLSEEIALSGAGIAGSIATVLGGAGSALADAASTELSFGAVDRPLILSIHDKIAALGSHPDSRGLANMLRAWNYTYTQMNTYRKTHALVYHQPRHAAEVCLDLLLLLKLPAHKKFEAHTLLLSLCGLFHDIIFTRKRVADETASAEELKKFLIPVLSKLPEALNSVIHDIIDWIIIAGTTPSFINKGSVPVLVSVAELCHTFLSTHTSTRSHGIDLSAASYQDLMYLARMIGDADIQRTSMPSVYTHKSLYLGEHWEHLKPFFNAVQDGASISLDLSLQRKLTQGMRILFENINAPSAEALKHYAANYQTLPEMGQSGGVILVAPALPSIDADTLQAIADAIGKPDNPFSEINFAQRTYDSLLHESTDLPPRQYEFINSWMQHKIVLSNIYNMLKGEASLEAKTKLIIALAKAAHDQDGKLVNCSELEVPLVTALKVSMTSAAPNAGAGRDDCCSIM